MSIHATHGQGDPVGLHGEGHQAIFLALTADAASRYPDVYTAYGAIL